MFRLTIMQLLGHNVSMKTKQEKAAYQKEWAQKNRSKRLESVRKYQAKMLAEDPVGYRERLNAASRLFYAKRVANDPAYLARKQAAGERWRSKDIEKVREQRRAALERYRKANPNAQRDLRRRKRIEILEFFGGICVKCGLSNQVALEVDHINGGGWSERKSGADTIWKQLKLIRNNPDLARSKYQLLCANCHAIKDCKHGLHQINPNPI